MALLESWYSASQLGREPDSAEDRRMSIFGRRILQRLINDNSRFMSERQTQRHVTLLNFNDARSAPAEWEIVLLNSFSRLGEVQYEPDWEDNQGHTCWCRGAESNRSLQKSLLFPMSGMKTPTQFESSRAHF